VLAVPGSLFSRSLDRRCGRSSLCGGRRGWSVVRGERLEAFERLEDRGGPGPVGGEVERGAAGVAGELAGDVQDPVAKSLGLADLVLGVEREQLRPDGDVVRGERELEPRGVRRERVEWQVGGAGRLERLDAVLDLGVLAMQDLERGDVRVGLGVGARAGRSAGCPQASRGG